MYFSDEIILITTDDSGTDEIGRQTETETGRVTVYGDIKSVSREESFTAGSHGYSNVQKFVLHPWDYSGEKYAMVDGKRKLIYRTYQADPDTLELYAATVRQPALASTPTPRAKPPTPTPRLPPSPCPRWLTVRSRPTRQTMPPPPR